MSSGDSFSANAEMSDIEKRLGVKLPGGLPVHVCVVHLHMYVNVVSQPA